MSLNPVSIPQNTWGNQNAFEGNAYVALHLFERDIEKLEYLQVQLKNEMVVGKEYEISFHVSLAENSEVATNGFGILFTTEMFTTTGRINQVPQFNSTDIIYDSDGWTKISGRFIAEEPYAYMTVGNFISQTGLYEIDTVINNVTPTMGVYYFDAFNLEPTGNAIDISMEVLNECFPVKVVFDPVNISNASEWIWNFSDGDIRTDRTVIRSFFDDLNLEVTLITTENGTTYTITRTFDIRGIHQAIADFDVVESVFVGDSIHLMNRSADATDFLWSFGDGNGSSLFEPSYSYSAPGTYEIKLNASTAGKCSAEFSKDIQVICKNTIIANAFTPNGDGKNDVFPFNELTGCSAEILINIYNSQGQRVYQSRDSTIPWSGEDQPQGTYYFVVQFDGGVAKGFIELHR